MPKVVAQISDTHRPHATQQHRFCRIVLCATSKAYHGTLTGCGATTTLRTVLSKFSFQSLLDQPRTLKVPPLHPPPKWPEVPLQEQIRDSCPDSSDTSHFGHFLARVQMMPGGPITALTVSFQAVNACAHKVYSGGGNARKSFTLNSSKTGHQAGTADGLVNGCGLPMAVFFPSSASSSIAHVLLSP